MHSHLGCVHSQSFPAHPLTTVVVAHAPWPEPHTPPSPRLQFPSNLALTPGRPSRPWTTNWGHGVPIFRDPQWIPARYRRSSLLSYVYIIICRTLFVHSFLLLVLAFGVLSFLSPRAASRYRLPLCARIPSCVSSSFDFFSAVCCSETQRPTRLSALRALTSSFLFSAGPPHHSYPLIAATRLRAAPPISGSLLCTPLGHSSSSLHPRGSEFQPRIISLPPRSPDTGPCFLSFTPNFVLVLPGRQRRDRGGFLFFFPLPPTTSGRRRVNVPPSPRDEEQPRFRKG